MPAHSGLGKVMAGNQPTQEEKPKQQKKGKKEVGIKNLFENRIKTRLLHWVPSENLDLLSNQESSKFNVTIFGDVAATAKKETTSPPPKKNSHRQSDITLHQIAFKEINQICNIVFGLIVGTHDTLNQKTPPKQKAASSVISRLHSTAFHDGIVSATQISSYQIGVVNYVDQKTTNCVQHEAAP